MTSATSTLPASLAKIAFKLEVLQNDQWVDFKPLIINGDHVSFDGIQVEQFLYNDAVNSAALKFNVHGRSCHVNIFFSEEKRGFIGSYRNGQGEDLVIRGSLAYKEIYDTHRRPCDAPSSSPYESWLPFAFETYWADFGDGSGYKLHAKYTLGDIDITDRTIVTHIHPATGCTTIELVPSLYPTFTEIDDARFTIALEAGGRIFTGTLLDSGQDFKFNGELADEIITEVNANYFRPLPAGAGSIRATAPVDSSGGLSVADLESVSPLTTMVDQNNKTFVYDAAQNIAGEYFNKCFPNGLEDDWEKKLFGQRLDVPERVQNIFNQHLSFFRNNSVLGTGQILFSTLQDNIDYQSTMQRVSEPALQKGWKELSGSKDTGPEYQAVMNALYCEGCRAGMTAIQPYLQDTGTNWGQLYYDFVTSPTQLTQWRMQIASGTFTNTNERMYGWHTKLAILNPDGSELPGKMLGTVFAALLAVHFQQAYWDDTIEPLLLQVVENALSGTFDGFDDIQNQLLEGNRNGLKEIIACYGGDAKLFCSQLAKAFKEYKKLKPTVPLTRIVTDHEFLTFIAPAFEGWAELTVKARFKKVMWGIAYGLGGAAIIWGIFMNSQKPLDFETAVQDMALGVMALGAVVESIQNVMSVGIGDWMRKYYMYNSGPVAEFAKDVATWFSKTGTVVPKGRSGKFFTAVFGDNVSNFFAKRIAPALAILGVVLCSVSLFQSIKAGDTAGIVFDSIYVFFALADLTLMFLAFGGFAWAGPIGLAVAIAGLVAVICNIIYNIIWPKRDPVKDFVAGPMRLKGFAHA